MPIREQDISDRRWPPAQRREADGWVGQRVQ